MIRILKLGPTENSGVLTEINPEISGARVSSNSIPFACAPITATTAMRRGSVCASRFRSEPRSKQPDHGIRSETELVQESEWFGTSKCSLRARLNRQTWPKKPASKRPFEFRRCFCFRNEHAAGLSGRRPLPLTLTHRCSNRVTAWVGRQDCAGHAGNSDKTRQAPPSRSRAKRRCWKHREQCCPSN